MSETAYDHANTARLSYSGAKILLEPGGPAKYRHMMDAPRVQKLEFDLGHAVHTKVLGIGSGIRVLDFDAYTTKAAKEAKAAAYADGVVPVLAHQAVAVDAAAEAVLAHPAAAKIYEDGTAEQVVTWEADDGTPMRGMVDWWSALYFHINDLKSATDASPRAFERAAANFHYDMQCAAYLEASRVITREEYRFTWTVVELRPPYLVAVYEPDEEMLRVGAENLAAARAIWNRCRETGVWPGLPENVQTISLPLWAIPEVEITI